MNIYLKLVPIALCAAGLTVWHLDQSREVERPAPSKAEPVKTRFAFPSFPVGSACRVDLDADEATFGLLTAREQDDQRRDWLLFGVVGDSGLAADEINRALYDVPPVRHGYLRPVARFEYGVTRSCCLGEGEIIALIPDGTDEERRDHLAHITDEHRKNLGRAPIRLHVFTYTLTPGGATVTRADPLAGDALLNPRQGYLEALIKDRAGLETFLAQTDDLVFVKAEPDGLRLGGRVRLPTPGRRKLTALDLAALWQAEQAIRQNRTAFEKKWVALRTAFDDKWKQRVDELNRKRRQQTHQNLLSPDDSYGTREGLLPRDPLQSFRDRLDKYGRHNPRALPSATPSLATASQDDNDDAILLTLPHEEAQRRFTITMATAESKLDQDYKEDRARAGLLDGAGFSLDAQLDFEAFTEAVSSPHFAALLRGSGILQARPRFDAELQQAMEPVRAQAARVKGGTAGSEHDRKVAIVPLFALLNELKNSSDKAAQKVKELFLYEYAACVTYQIARYDGPLEGTEVGMTLFYTDLLAKLWALNYSDQRAPSDKIADFVPLTEVAVSPVYSKEIAKLNRARLWFGMEDNGFQVAGGSVLQFAPNATRLYAASHETLTPGEEKTASPEYEAFLGWWNDHYEEVARFEPEYQRLNDIMKWSIATRWLADQGDSNLLGFLGDLKPTHTAWFPDWAKRTHPSGAKVWEQSFLEKGSYGIKTEAMARLYSEEYYSVGTGEISALEGGISLATGKKLREHVPLSEDLPLALRRAELDHSKTTDPANLTNLRGTTYRLAHAAPAEGSTARLSDRATLSITGGGDDPRFRTRYGELASKRGSVSERFERTVSRDAGQLQIEVRDGAGEIGVFESTARPAKNGLRIGWRSRALDDGFSLGRRLSAGGPKLSVVLERDATVERAVQLGEDYYVKQLGSRQWMKVGKQKTPGEQVPAGWQAQLADVSPGAQSLNLDWLDEQKLPADIWQKGNRIRGPPPGSSGSGGITGGADGILPPGGSFGDSAKLLVADVDKRRRQVDAEWRGVLPQIDRLLAESQLSTARRMTEEMLDTYGPRPELLSRSELLATLRDIDDKLEGRNFDEARQLVEQALAARPDSEGLRIRKALAEIGAGRKVEAAAAVDAVPVAASDVFLRELTGRVRRAKDQTEIDGWREAALLMDHRRHLERTHPEDALRISLEDGRMAGTLHVNGAPALETVHTRPSVGTFYYESSFASLDVNGVPSGAALDQLISQGAVKKLPREDIGHFEPWNVSISVGLADAPPKERTFLQAWPESGYRQPAALAWYRYRAVYYPWNGTGNSDADDDEKKKRPSVTGWEEAVKRSQIARQTVYLVLNPAKSTAADHAEVPIPVP